MGNKGSLPLEAVDGFSTEEVSRLEKRFKKLDLDQNGTIRFAKCRLSIMSCPNFTKPSYHFVTASLMTGYIIDGGHAVRFKLNNLYLS